MSLKVATFKRTDRRPQRGERQRAVRLIQGLGFEGYPVRDWRPKRQASNTHCPPTYEERFMSERVSVCLKLNNTATNDPCAVCGGRTDPAVGLDFFKEGTWELICAACVERHAPDLVAFRDQANRAALFENEEESF